MWSYTSTHPIRLRGVNQKSTGKLIISEVKYIFVVFRNFMLNIRVFLIVDTGVPKHKNKMWHANFYIDINI
jgi:hypothetical protein